MKTKLIKRGSTGYSDGVSMSQITESDFYKNVESGKYDMAARELLRISFGERYSWYEKSPFITYLKSYVSDFLNCMSNHERAIDYENAYFRLEQAVLGMENESADKRIVFGMMNVLKNVLIEEKSDREKEMLDFQYSCMMQMMQVINNLGHKRDNETVFAQWISNSIAREMLTYGEGNDGDGTTVEVAVAHDDLSLVFGKTFLVVTPTAAEFKSRLVGFSARVHRQNLVIAESLGDIFLVRSEAVVVESAGGQGNLLSLINHGFDDLRMTVTLVHCGISGKEVEVFLAFHVPYEGTFTACDDHAQGMIVVRAIAGFHIHCLLA